MPSLKPPVIGELIPAFEQPVQLRKTRPRKVFFWFSLISGAVIACFVLGVFLWVYIHNNIVQRNTASAWSQYQEIEHQKSALFDLDPWEAVKKRRNAYFEVYSLDIDQDLKNFIANRISLLDKLTSLKAEGDKKASSLEVKGGIRGFVGGMVGGLLNPDNPLESGAAIGSIADSSVDKEVDELQAQFNSALDALNEEDKKLDAYENELRNILAKRYGWNQ